MAKQKLTFEKRAREKAKQLKRKEKFDRRSDRKKEKEENVVADCEGDPDIAGIIPGPQPISEDDY